MPKDDYVKSTDAEFCIQINHVAATLPQFYSQFNLTASDPLVAGNILDAQNFDYLCKRQVKLLDASQGATAERNRARKGDPLNPGAAVDLAYPSNSTPPPSPVMPGIEKRFRAFVDFLRTRPTWSEAAAETLGVNGPQVTRPDPATLQPVLTLALSGGRVEVGWKWGPARGVVKALRIEVDRGNGWEFLTIDTQPGYVDTHVLPATAQKWKYRAIWVIDETLVGQWSAVVDLAVSA